MTKNSNPFEDLPGALVADVLSKTEELGNQLLINFTKNKTDRPSIRDHLSKSELLLNESSLGYPPLPTTCATDGSYAIERLLTTDLAAAAAVAVEGLTPPSEKRFWEAPYHKTLIYAEKHNEKTSTILRSAMLGEELLLAVKAPHDLVLLDCTLTLPIIYFNQGISAANGNQSLSISKKLLSNATEYLTAYREILRCSRSDHQFAGLPKYSTRREIGSAANWDTAVDDRGLLTLVLDPGEFTKPILLEKSAQPWHIGVKPLKDKNKDVQLLAEEIVSLIDNIHIFYYKPHDWLPALRVETSREIANNRHRLATVLQGLKYQCATAAMLEPYPLYLADRTVKALSRAIPAFRHATTQRIAEKYAGDIGEVFHAMHGYRTEDGR